MSTRRTSSHLHLDRIRNGTVNICSPDASGSWWGIHKHRWCPLGWKLGVGRGFGGFENLNSELGDLVEQHGLDILRCKVLGFVEGFVVGVTEEE